VSAVDLFAALDQKKQRALQALQANDLARAEGLLREVCETTPGDLQAWLLRAAVHGQGGRMAQVVGCCERVLEVDPQNVQALSYLGNAHFFSGRYAAAAAAYRQAVAVAPGEATLRCGLGQALTAGGEGEEAVGCFEAALGLAPHSAEGHCGLASALAAVGRRDEAVVHYRKAVQLDPQLLDGHVNLGGLLAHLGQLEEAEQVLRRGLLTFPEAAELYQALANVLRYAGRLDAALVAYRRALEIRPGDGGALAGEAEIYERKGEGGEAYRRVRALIDQGVVEVTTVVVYLQVCRQHGSAEEAIALARRLLAALPPSAPARCDVHFALGGLFDKLGDYDRAFGEYEEANRNTAGEYDPARHTAYVDSLIAGFSADAVARMARAKLRSDRPILILGMPRSGTSLVEQILASHPQVFGGGELVDLERIVAGLPATVYPACMEAMAEGELDTLARRYLTRIERLGQGAARVTDKMPGNYMNLGLIAMILPGVRVIHCVRDPLDTCLSIYFQHFNFTHGYATDLRNLGLRYRDYQRLMAHWCAVLDLPILEVRYADLVTDSERVSREMVAFVGLPWDDRCRNFHETHRKVATASYDQVRQPIYTSSLARWRHYEAHLGPLREALGIG